MEKFIESDLQPSVSVIITCYNYGRFLKECIESVLTQTFKDLEIIVINDGSMDETEAVCSSFGENIRYHAQPHLGVVKALNTGIEMSRGHFFYFLSADDKLFPKTIERQLEVMKEDETCAVVCGNAKLINERGEETGDSIQPLPEKKADLLFCMLFSPTLHDGSLLWRRSALEAIGGLYFKPFENYHGYHHRCFQLARKFRIRHLDEFLVSQRVHQDNLSHPKNKVAMIEGYGILRKKMREIIDPCEILEGADPMHSQDRARAHFLIATLYFFFGQYEIAYQDLKSAIELDPEIWEKKEVIDDPRLHAVFNVYLSPVLPVETIVNDQSLIARIEAQKRTEVDEILSKLKEGEILKSFFLCRKGLEEAPDDPDFLLLLAVVYLSQPQWHDSLNRLHNVTKGLLEELLARYPFHSIELYICLALVKTEDDLLLHQLQERSHLLGWFDLNLCLWLTKMAVLFGRSKLTEQLQTIFRKKGYKLNISRKRDQEFTGETKVNWEGKKENLIRRNKDEKGCPLVSVIVPTYNRPDMLMEALRSILSQTYSHYEIIVVNDGGIEVENRLPLLNPNKNIIYIKLASHRERSSARNIGIQKARGKYIAYLDDDDIYYPDHLETLVSFLEKSDYKVAYTDAHRAHQKRENGGYVVVKRDIPYSFDFDNNRILIENFVPILCVMHEKSCLDEVGCFDEVLTTLEDWDLWIRMSRKFKFAHIPKVTCEFSWREDGTTTTSGKWLDFIRNRKRIYERYRDYSKDKPHVIQVQESFLKHFDEMIKQEYDRIQQLIQKNLIEEAIPALEKLITLSPAHSFAHDDLGVLYYHRGDKERALNHFIQSLQADPRNQNAMKNMADLCIALGRIEEALQLYQIVLADQPTDVEALLKMGDLSFQTGRSGEATSFYTKALEIEPENDSAKQRLEILSHRSPDSFVFEEASHPSREPNRADSNQRLVSIILPAYNQLEYTQKCLESIFKYTDAPFELIIIDNGSTDGTLRYLGELKEGRATVGGWRVKVGEDGEVLEGRFENEKSKGRKKSKKKQLVCKRFKVIHNEKNLGFAAGNNQGIVEARGDYILLMNNDVVVTPGWLGRMIAVAERDSKIGIVGPMSNYVSGPQWVEKVDYDTTTLKGLNQFAQDFAQTHRGQAKPFWRVVGFCMLIKRAVVEKIGGLDGRYGLGNFEDDDFSIRAWLAGFESWIAGDCFIHHFGSRTFVSSGIDYNESLKKNWEIFKKKWGIPPDVGYGSPFDLSGILRRGFHPGQHYCPMKPEEDSLLRGEELFQSGDVEGAKMIFNRLLQKNPEDVNLINNLGVIFYQEGEVDQAITYWNRALALNPAHLDTLVNLGHCLMVKKAYKEAIPIFEKALELKPDDLSLLNSLGNCLIQTGEFLRAQEVYNRSYRLNSEQTEVREILMGLEQVKSMDTERRVAL